MHLIVHLLARLEKLGLLKLQLLLLRNLFITFSEKVSHLEITDVKLGAIVDLIDVFMDIDFAFVRKLRLAAIVMFEHGCMHALS